MASAVDRDAAYFHRMMKDMPAADALRAGELGRIVEEATHAQIKTVLERIGVRFAPNASWITIQNRARKAGVSVIYDENPTLPGQGGYFVRKFDEVKAIVCPYVDEKTNEFKVRILSKN